MPVLIVMAALSAGTALTVWNAPEVMIGGEIVAVRLPAPSGACVGKNGEVWSRPVDCFVFRVHREDVRDGEHITGIQAGSRSGGPAIGDQRLRPSVLGGGVGHGLSAAVDQRVPPSGPTVWVGEDGFIVVETGVAANLAISRAFLLLPSTGCPGSARPPGRTCRAVGTRGVR